LIAPQADPASAALEPSFGNQPEFFAKGAVHDRFGQPDRKCLSGLKAQSVMSHLLAAFACPDSGDAGAPPATSTPSTIKPPAAFRL